MNIFKKTRKTNTNKHREYSVKKNKQNRIRKSWKEIFIKTIFYLSFIGFIALAVWTILFSKAVKIKKIEVNGKFYGEKISENDINELVSGKYFHVLPKDNILFVTKNRLTRAIKDRDKTVREVLIKKIFPDKLVVEIVQRKTMLIWLKSGKRFLVDEDGKAFFQVNSESEITQDMVVVKDGAEGDIQIDDRVVSGETALFFHDLPAITKEKTGLEMEKEIFMPSKMSQEARIRTKEGWLVYFNLSESLDYQTSVLKKLLLENIPLDKQGELEYIDLRLKGRAIYKLKQEQEKSEEENSENEEDDAKSDE